MIREVTIDRLGRLVIPKEVREMHRLEAGSRLTLIDEDDRLVLVPGNPAATLIEQDGILVVRGVVAPEEIPDHRTLREDRDQTLARPE